MSFQYQKPTNIVVNQSHRPNTKKHWHIYYWEYDEVDEIWKMYCDQVNFLYALYYKTQKWKKIDLTCPDCFETFSDILQTIEN